MIIVLLLLQLLTIVLVLWLRSKMETTTTGGAPKYVVDTSALIDGRIENVAKHGFLPGVIYIPKFVLAELQHIADSTNELRRSRGRYGLELVRTLQSASETNVKIISDDPSDIEKVDDKLVAVAKKRRGAIITTDFNLNRVATIQDVVVLNVNELAHSLRPIVLPGEEITIKLVQKGSDVHQGVGYLEDGTMVVVDHANRLIGREVKVSVTRIMQTVAGKMLFASLVKKDSRHSKSV